MTFPIMSRSCLPRVRLLPLLPRGPHLPAPANSCRGPGDRAGAVPARAARHTSIRPLTASRATSRVRCAAGSATSAPPSSDHTGNVEQVVFDCSWIWTHLILVTQLTAGYAGYERVPDTLWWPVLFCLVVPPWALQIRRSFPLSGALVNCICSGLFSFFMLGDLLNRAWIPAVSGGISIASARLSVMAQYIGCAAAALAGVHLLWKAVADVLSVTAYQGPDAKRKAPQHPAVPAQKPSREAAGRDISGSSNMAAAISALDGQHGQHAEVVAGTEPVSQHSPGEPNTIPQSPDTPDGSCSEQPHAVTAQAALGRAQEDSASALATAAAEEAAGSPQELPADGGQARDDLTAAQDAHGRHAAEPPAKELEKWQAHIGRRVGQGWELVPVTDAELAQHYAPRKRRHGDELAMDVAHHHGRVYTRAGSSPDRHPGSSKSSHAQHLMTSPSGEPSEAVKELLAQRAELLKERDSLQQDVEVLRDQLESRSAQADSQAAKLKGEIKQLSEHQRELELQLDQARLSQSYGTSTDQYMPLQGAQEDALTQAALASYTHLMSTLTAMLGANGSAADDSPAANIDADNVSRARNVEPWEVETVTLPDMLKEAEAEAQVAWNKLSTCMAALRSRLRQHQHSGPEAHLPFLAAWLLHSQRLSADIAAKRAEVATGTTLLREACACPGWEATTAHQHGLHRNVDDLLRRLEDEMETGSDWRNEPPAPDVNEAMSSPAVWTGRAGELAQQLQQQQSQKLELTQQAIEVQRVLKVVADRIFDELRHGGSPLSDRAALNRWLFWAGPRMQGSQDLSALDAAKQEMALCNCIARHCAAVLNGQGPSTPQGADPEPQGQVVALKPRPDPHSRAASAEHGPAAAAVEACAAATPTADATAERQGKDQPLQADAEASRAGPEAPSPAIDAGPANEADTEASTSTGSSDLEAPGAVADPLTQHAGLIRERDSLHLGVKILSDQLKSRAAQADLQEAKLDAEIQQLSGQLSEQQHQAQQAAGELQTLQKQHAAVTEEADSLHLRVEMLTAQLGSGADGPDLSQVHVALAIQQMLEQLLEQPALLMDGLAAVKKGVRKQRKQAKGMIEVNRDAEELVDKMISMQESRPATLTSILEEWQRCRRHKLKTPYLNLLAMHIAPLLAMHLSENIGAKAALQPSASASEQGAQGQHQRAASGNVDVAGQQLRPDADNMAAAGRVHQEASEDCNTDLAEAQAEAAAARQTMDEHIAHLRERFDSTATFELPRAAQQLLHNHSLAADIAQARAQTSVYRDILETVQAHGSWCNAMRPAWKLRQQVHELVKVPISWQLEEDLADLSKMDLAGRHLQELFMEGQTTDGKLQVALTELEIVREAFHEVYARVGLWHPLQYGNDSMAAAASEMKDMFARAPAMISSRLQACALAATRQQIAICNQLTAYCANSLSGKEASRTSSTPSAMDLIAENTQAETWTEPKMKNKKNGTGGTSREKAAAGKASTKAKSAKKTSRQKRP